MADVPEHELSALRTLSGYDQMLEIDRVTKQYGITEAELMEVLNSTTQPSQNYSPSSEEYDPSGTANAHFIPDVKEAATIPATATMLDKSNFRFEYDPSQEAAQRRAAVAQAIICPGCGVALGIPDVRPIKVTCPQCLQETVFDA